MPSAAPPIAPPRPPISSAGKRLGLKAEPPNDSDWQLSLVVKNRAGKTMRARGPVTARKLRQVVISHQMRMESRRLRLTGSGDPRPRIAPSRIKKHKTIEGEQRPLKLPLLALHPKYGKTIRISARVLAGVLDFLCYPLK